MEYSRKDFEKIQMEVVENICNLSKFTSEEANQIYVTFPNYMQMLHKLNKGATTKEVALYILNKLK
tara:strand:- start:17 stop:214 length:198 start_codon:yes stop_codon:yes gene_type:complete